MRGVVVVVVVVPARSPRIDIHMMMMRVLYCTVLYLMTRTHNEQQRTSAPYNPWFNAQIKGARGGRSFRFIETCGRGVPSCPLHALHCRLATPRSRATEHLA